MCAVCEEYGAISCPVCENPPRYEECGQCGGIGYEEQEQESGEIIRRNADTAKAAAELKFIKI